MSRAGREPAEDVKKRIVSRCKRAGLRIDTARMYLRRQHGDRVILVAASPVDWEHERSMITVLTTVSVAGDWSATVDIRCSTAEDGSITNFWDNPVMQGRHNVPIDELTDQLRETLRERDEVTAAMKLGLDGPFRFSRSTWRKPSDLLFT